MISSLELARLCGVSQGTVDRALHGRPGISVETRDRILAHAQEHGYRPNPAARELITGQSRIVGAVIPSVNNIFFMDLFNMLGRRLKQRNLQLQMTPVDTREEFLSVLDEFAARRHRMALVIPPEEGISIPKSITNCFPLISMLSPCKGRGIHFLSPDEEETGRAAVEYLYARGHRRILHFTYPRERYAIRARATGYERQMRTFGLKPSVLTNVDRESFYQVLKAEKPTALFCHNDWLAITAGMFLASEGICVPEDISILGVDNSPTLISIHPHLTTLNYPVKSLSQGALDILDGKPGTMETVRFEVVERETVRNI